MAASDGHQNVVNRYNAELLRMIRERAPRRTDGTAMAAQPEDDVAGRQARRETPSVRVPAAAETVARATRWVHLLKKVGKR